MHTLEMGLEIICAGPNLLLILAGADLANITVANRLASRMYASLMSVKIIRRGKPLDSARTISNIAFEWFFVTLFMFPWTAMSAWAPLDGNNQGRNTNFFSELVLTAFPHSSHVLISSGIWPGQVLDGAPMII